MSIIEKLGIAPVESWEGEQYNLLKASELDMRSGLENRKALIDKVLELEQQRDDLLKVSIDCLCDSENYELSD